MDLFSRTFLTILLIQSCSCDFLKDFLILKEIRYATVINCNETLNRDIFKNLAQINIFSSICSSNNCLEHIQRLLKTSIYINTDCQNWRTLLEKIAEKELFRYPYIWLIETSKYQELISKLSTLPLSFDSEVTIALKTSDNYQLYEVYNSGFYNNGTFNSTFIGNWTKNCGMKILSQQWKYLSRANMSGVILQSMIVVTKELRGERFEDYVVSPRLPHIDSMNRFNYALLLHLSDIFNFKYKLMRTNSWGYLRNGSFDGMVGELERKRIDIGASPIFFRADRARVIDYTAQTWISRPCFIFRHPTQPDYFFNIYTRPLASNVWYLTLALLTAAAVLMRCLMKDGPAADEGTSWSFTTLAMVGAICQQGLFLDNRSTAVRLILFTMFLFSITMYQFYNASITSSLLMEAPKNIRTLEDLLRSPLRAGVEDIIYNRDYFTRTSDSVALELFRKKISTARSQNFFAPAEGLALVKKGGFAFHVDIATAYKIIRDTFSEREVCELVEIQLFPPQKMVAIVQKGSPYREIITYGLRKITESGLMSRQRAFWHEAKPRCVHTPDSSVFSVDLYEFSMVLLTLACGVLLSLAILLLEILHHSVCRSQEIKQGAPTPRAFTCNVTF